MSYIIPTVIILAIVQFFLDKKIRVPLVYGGSMSDSGGFKLYAWTIVILIIPTAIVCFYFANEIHPLVGILLMILFTVRAAFEWKYIRRTNRHIVSLLMAVISLLLSIIFYLVWTS